jgi:hypothetical protein
LLNYSILFFLEFNLTFFLQNLYYFTKKKFVLNFKYLKFNTNFFFVIKDKISFICYKLLNYSFLFNLFNFFYFPFFNFSTKNSFYKFNFFFYLIYFYKN